MLTFYGSGTEVRGPADLAADGMPPGVDWIDALRPTAEEMGYLERCFGTKLPGREALLEVEASSRMAVSGDAVLLSMPATVRDEDGNPAMTPIGFAVNERCALTIRFERLAAFQALASRAHRRDVPSPGGPGAAITILETMVDHLADVLERASGELDALSRQVFRRAGQRGRKGAPKGRAKGASEGASNAGSGSGQRFNAVLAEVLQAVGQEADLTSRVSESLLVLSRIAPFLSARALPPVAPELRSRLETVAEDARSLREFQDHLSNKTAFLLDALLGLSNIETNDVFRILTLVSVIAIPPTFFAGMYGMNFKYMPELDWRFGYLYGLAVIVTSAVIPALWFKRKGWW